MDTVTEMVFTDKQIEDVDKLIDEYGRKPGGLIPLLEKIQELLGYVPVFIQKRIADRSGIPPNRIYGVVSFYSYFTMEPKARHRIQVCMGTACYMKGGKEIAEKIEHQYGIQAGESTMDGRFTYERTRCFGACGLAPVVVIDGKVYGKVTLNGLDDILKQYE